MFVDLDNFDQNIDAIKAKLAGKKQTLRMATKSVRVLDLIKYIDQRGGDQFQGFMCFSCQEADFLASHGLDDFLVAYPTMEKVDLEVAHRLSQAGKKIYLMVDRSEQVNFIEDFLKSKGDSSHLRVCIDVDMSLRLFGGSVHLGVRRSSISSLAQFKSLVEFIESKESIKFAGVMGYEAQVAGLGDRNPFAPLLNPIKQWIRYFSVQRIKKLRGSISTYLKERGLTPEVYNGGGTGSLSTTLEEEWLTEVTAGSGFLQSHLFDYYSNHKNKPAFFFGLRVTRAPAEGFITCQSGGFIASGESGPDKAPIPYLPEGLKTIGTEGFGEVQTPLITKDHDLKPGDPVFFRPSKAGEIAERFEHYILIRGGKIEKKVPTYRGHEKTFY